MPYNQVNTDIGIRLLTLYNQLKNTGKVKSQKEFAEKIGILPSHITEIKKGRSRISVKKLQEITGEFEKYKEWLITGKNSPFASGEFQIDEINARTVERLEDGRYVIPEGMWMDYMRRIETQNENDANKEMLKALEEEVSALREEILELKKTNVQGGDVECADVG